MLSLLGLGVSTHYKIIPYKDLVDAGSVTIDKGIEPKISRALNNI